MRLAVVGTAGSLAPRLAVHRRNPKSLPPDPLASPVANQKQAAIRRESEGRRWEEALTSLPARRSCGLTTLDWDLPDSPLPQSLAEHDASIVRRKLWSTCTAGPRELPDVVPFSVHNPNLGRARAV